MPHDYTKCDVCGGTLGPDPLHIAIDNGHVVRHTYAHREHRYVQVRTVEKQFRSINRNYREEWMDVEVWKTQTRTDHEIEALAFRFRLGELPKGFELIDGPDAPAGAGDRVEAYRG